MAVQLATGLLKTPLLEDGLLGRIWTRWFTALVQIVNQQTAPITFAQLPASPVAGMQFCITDGDTTTWGAVLAGGGLSTVLAFYNGTNWTVAAI